MHFKEKIGISNFRQKNKIDRSMSNDNKRCPANIDLKQNIIFHKREKLLRSNIDRKQ